MFSLLQRVSSRPLWVLILPALVALLGASLPTWIAGAPEPFIEDEFGYLLSAQTFAEGRLTNEPHELWTQFETLHQIQQPSYNSKYPPGQALLLAVGWKLGHPIVGVWLGLALMVASLAWMLMAWFSSGWAWVGAWVATFQYGWIGLAFGESTFAYWSQSYWGGALAAAGGALMFGGAVRLVRETTPQAAWALGFGLLLLANTRPLEGLIACLLPCLWLAFTLVRSGRLAQSATWTRLIVPILLILGPGFYAMGQYNRAVTGDAFEMPWNVHHEQYCVFPLFIVQDSIESRDWRHDDMRQFHDQVERHMHEKHGSLKGLAVATAGKLARFTIFFFGPIYALLLLLSARSWLRDRRFWMLAAPLALVLGTGILKFNAPPHYLAPATGLALAWIVLGMRALYEWSPQGKPLGQTLVRIGLLASLLYGGYGIALATQSSERTQSYPRFVAERKLEALPGKHLVFVTYGPQPPNFRQWLFNEANLDQARIVWARDSGPESRAALKAAFPGRKVWSVRTGFPGEPQELVEGAPRGPLPGDAGQAD